MSRITRILAAVDLSDVRDAPFNSAVVTVGAFLSGNAGNGHRAVGDLAPVDPDDHARGSTACAGEGPVDHEDSSGEFRLLPRDSRRRGWRGARQRPRRDGESRSNCPRGVWRTRRHVPGTELLGSEDFAFMLQKKKGTYCLLGNGDTAMVHHPQYVFDDAILPMGAAYWVMLTERYLQ
jgi:hippurate hydrolase